MKIAGFEAEDKVFALYIARFLSTESVEGTSLPLQSIDDIHGSDSLPLGVLSVGDRVSDHILKENFEDSAGFFVDQPWDTLDTSPPRKTTDGRLGDALDVELIC